jgi:hypothetical protein
VATREVEVTAKVDMARVAMVAREDMASNLRMEAKAAMVVKVAMVAKVDITSNPDMEAKAAMEGPKAVMVAKVDMASNLLDMEAKVATELKAVINNPDTVEPQVDTASKVGTTPEPRIKSVCFFELNLIGMT